MIVYVVVGSNDEVPTWNVRGFLREAAAEEHAARLNQEVEAWKVAQAVWLKRMEKAVPWMAPWREPTPDAWNYRAAWIKENPAPARPESGDETVHYLVAPLEVTE